MNWGSVSVDPNNSLMFVNDMRLGLANYMVPRAHVAKNASGIEMGIVPMDGTPFGTMRERFPVAAGHSVSETAVRHHVGSGSEIR